jgi:hypothetical protein
VVDHTPVKHEVFGSIPSTGIKKKKRVLEELKLLEESVAMKKVS